jgi:hypothetical protein
MADQSRAKSCQAAQAIPLVVAALITSLLSLFSLRDVSAATSMTLVRRESQPISEGQTIIRSHYLRERPVIASVRLAPTTVTQEIIVVGCGVNYDANRGVGQPSWLPSQAALQPSAQAGVAFECTANPLEMRLPTDTGHPLQLTKNGAQVSCRLVGARLVAAEKKDDQTARYSNVYPDTDLEWKIGKGFLKESLIVRSRNAPAVFSFSLQTDAATKLLVPDRSARPFRQRDLLASPTAAPERIRGSILISRDERSTRGLIRMLPATVQDADGHTTRMITTVLCGPDRSLLYTIAIPKEFYSDPALKFPLVVDPTFINVPNEEFPVVYEAGKTYYIASMVWYSYWGVTIRVEANAVLKFDPCGYLYFERSYYEGSMLRVEGTPYNYAIFTSGFDDTVGADTDGGPGLPLNEGDPYPGAYPNAIVLDLHDYDWELDESEEIRYAKFAYASSAVSFLMDSGLSDSAQLLIRDCVFRDNYCAVAICGAPNPCITASISNCLFVGGPASFGTGILAGEGNTNLAVENCTFDGFSGEYGTAIWLDGSPLGATALYCTIRNNIFARSTRAVYLHEAANAVLDLDYSGLYQVQTYAGGFATAGPHSWDPTPLDPFETNANGSYYLKELPNDLDFRDKGDSTAQQAGLAGKATLAATVSNGRNKQNNITQSETWTRFEAALDTGQLDLGYHYDPVDIIVEPAYDPQEGFADLHVIGPSTTLWINPGVVVAFSADIEYGTEEENFSHRARIVVGNSAAIDAQGSGPQPITFTSSAASGDGTLYEKGIGHPKNDGLGRYIWYDTAIHLAAAGRNTRIRYCQFQFMRCGIVVEAWPYSAALDINNCRFGFGDIGIAANSTVLGKTGVKVRNSLLHRLASAGVETFSPELNSEVLVENCTFDQGTKGVYAYSAQTTIRNCIFANTGYGIFVQFGNALKAENHNCFYQSSILFERDPSDIWQVDPQFDPGSPPTPDIGERYYLDQDYSPCVDKGSPNDIPYMSTALDGWLDVGKVDIGYHYPENPMYRGAIHPRGSSLPILGGSVHYPRPCQLRDGRILCAYTWKDGYWNVSVCPSFDYGRTWQAVSNPISEQGKDFMNPHLIQLRHQGNPDYNGKVLLVTNYAHMDDPVPDEAGIRIFEWKDETPAWLQEWSTQPIHKDVGTGWELWEPFLLELSDGRLICFFTRSPGDPSEYPPDDVSGPGYIAAMTSDDGGKNWFGESGGSTPIKVALTGSDDFVDHKFNHKHHGMAWAVELPNGEVYVVFEAGDFENQDESWMGIRSNRSSDGGASWPMKGYSDRYPVVYDPGDGAFAGCPNIVRLTDGRLLCSFMTNEDDLSLPYDLHSDVKAVVGDGTGYNWSNSSFVIVDDREISHHCSWQGLIRLRNEDLLCTFWNGWEGEYGDELRSTTVEYRPAVLADDFDDGNAQGWSPSGNWAVVEGSAGDFNYSCNGTGMSLVGLPKWADYVMSVDLESFTGEAGIVFHALDANNFYFFGLDKNTGWRSIWKYVNGTRQQPALATTQVAVTEPMVLRMTRLSDGSFLCYANGAQLRFSDTSFSGGRVGLRVQTGSATFDNVAVHGANAFLDLNTGFEEFLIDDRFHHINIGGTPYMWALLGNWEVAQETTHGKYFKGKSQSSDTPAEAWRGEEGWVNYRVLADVRLESDNAEANVYVRHTHWSNPAISPYHGFQYYRCVLSYNAQNGQGTLDLKKHWLWPYLSWPHPPYPTPGWHDDSLGSITIPGFNRQSWHVVEVEVKDIEPGPGVQIKCYLDGSALPQISVDDDGTVILYSSILYNGRVGLAAGKKENSPLGTESASFDNVFVLDLGE